MAEQPVLEAEKRTQFGSRACRKLRDSGIVPGNVYGHRQDPVPIAVPQDVINAVVHSGHKVVDLQVDGTRETAILKEVQWDTFGIRIHHFDLLRVSADERVEVSVPLELKGTAPGILSGGMLEHHLHELTVECRALEIPDSIPVRINTLELGQAIYVRDLEIPAGITVKDSPDEMVVHVIKPSAEIPESAALEPGPTEPEVIRETKDVVPEEEK